MWSRSSHPIRVRRRLRSPSWIILVPGLPPLSALAAAMHCDFARQGPEFCFLIGRRCSIFNCDLEAPGPGYRYFLTEEYFLVCFPNEQSTSKTPTPSCCEAELLHTWKEAKQNVPMAPAPEVSRLKKRPRLPQKAPKEFLIGGLRLRLCN